MRKMIAFVPAVCFGILFIILGTVFREFNLSLCLIVCAFVLSGVFSSVDRHILSLIAAALPVSYFIMLSEHGGEGNMNIGLMTAGTVVLFYICYYAAIIVYHHEKNKD